MFGFCFDNIFISECLITKSGILLLSHNIIIYSPFNKVFVYACTCSL